MTIIKNIIVSASLLLIANTPTSSQAITTAPTAAVATPNATTPAVTNREKATEVELLQQEVKVIKEYHSSLLDTVYWALGGIFTMAALLSGFGWWSNFRIYENDKKSLREELDAKIKSYESMIDGKNQAARRDLEIILDAKQEAALNRSTTELSDIRLSLNAIRQEMKQELEKISETTSGAKAEVEIIRRKISATNAELRYVEEQVWDIKGVPMNILITQVQGLASAIESKSNSRVKSILTRIKETISEYFVKASKTIDADGFRLIDERLKSAEGQEPLEVAEVRTLLKSVLAATVEK